jgi:hypothetical protein
VVTSAKLFLLNTIIKSVRHYLAIFIIHALPENVADAVHASFIRSYQLIRNQTFMSSLEYMVARIEKVTGDDEEQVGECGWCALLCAQATSVSMLAADPAETDPALLADLQSTAVEAKHRLETTERRLQDALLNAEAEQSADVDAVRLVRAHADSAMF